jgi:hemerythrin-like metal-binding protein
MVNHALTNDLFTIFYQPKLNLRTRKIESAEALVRIISENGKVIPPDNFIPGAEKNGSIIEIDKWVINRIIEDARYISMMAEEDITISFNVSGLHFNKVNFLENLSNMFRFTNDFISRFEIELTEGALIENVEDAMEKMRAIKKMGFKLAIDDFGTGYSSLVYLKDFPIDCLKIDKVFVDEIPGNEKTVKIVDSIIYLAKKLGLKIVAEGVETAEQLVWLHQNSCDEIQGYIYSKPLPVNIFAKFVKATNEPESKRKYIIWDTSYSIGHYVFDTHHMIIANILNKLYEEISEKELNNRTDIQEYIILLDRYVKIHFRAEEDFMKNNHYPDMDEHINVHRQFEQTLDELKGDISQGKKKLDHALFMMLKDWLQNHELRYDKLFMPV